MTNVDLLTNNLLQRKKETLAARADLRSDWFFPLITPPPPPLLCTPPPPPTDSTLDDVRKLKVCIELSGLRLNKPRLPGGELSQWLPAPGKGGAEPYSGLVGKADDARGKKQILFFFLTSPCGKNSGRPNQFRER